jgi:hypothetical protein
LKITKHFLYFKITLTEDFEELFLKKKKKQDKHGEYIDFKAGTIISVISTNMFLLNEIHIYDKFEIRLFFVIS